MNQSLDIERGSTLYRDLHAAIKQYAILSSNNQMLVSPAGRKNTWLIDLRRILLTAKYIDIISTLFLDIYETRMPFQVGGMEVAAIPLVVSIILKSSLRGTPINGFIIRKERKTYGAGNLIEGQVSDVPILIVDDLFNSGKSLEKVRVVLNRRGRKIDEVFAVIQNHSERGEAWKSSHGIPVRSLFSLSDFGLSMGTPRREEHPSSKYLPCWSFSAPNPSFFHLVPKSFPEISGNRILFGSDAGFLFCLDATTGKELWRFKVVTGGNKNIWSAPAAWDGRVYFGAYDGNVYCLDVATGDEIWRFTGADWVGSSPAIAPDLGLLFIGLEFSVEGKRGGIAALRMSDGSVEWDHRNKRYTHASPRYCPELQVVGCGSNDNEMFLFNARDGRMLWRFETSPQHGQKGSIRHAPAFDLKRNSVITGCADGCVYVIDITTGQNVWSVKTDNTIYTVPLVVGDFCYIGSTDKYFYILDLEKMVVAQKIRIGSKIFAPPRLINGRIYFGASDGRVFELDSRSHQITGTHQLPDAITNAIAFSADTKLFYALTYMNELFAFRRDEQSAIAV